MSDLSSGISPIVPRVEPVSSPKDTSISLKINGLNYLFDPSKTQGMSPKMDASPSRAAIVLPAVVRLRPENASLGRDHATVYHIELDPLEKLDADGESEVEEPVEPIDEEMDEKEDSEEPSSFDTKPGLQEGDFLSEEDLKDALYELMLEETVTNQMAKKAWRKAKRSLLESLHRNRKELTALTIQSETVSYFSLLSL
jgi:hypothetical protein